MSGYQSHAAAEPSRDEVDRTAGWVVVEFGAAWCPHCTGIQSLLKAEFERHPEVRHIKVEDGPGRPLGRSFRVKLWPTLVLLRDGQVVHQFVRPDAAEVREAFAAIDA
jgi:thioredoxin 1